MSNETLQVLVSVVTACHNAEPFVAETIESVLAQTHPAVEHVLVDDASTDGSWEVIERYAAAHPHRVRALRLDANRGGCFARNRGAEQARGGFLMFLDADDLIAPDTLAALADSVRDVPLGIAVCAWKNLEQRDGRWVESGGGVPEPGTDHLWSWLDGKGAATCSVLWRRDAYDLTGGWDEALAYDQDSDVTHRALALGARVVRARGGMGFYRRHGQARASVSTTVSARKLASWMKVNENLEELLTRQGRLDQYAEKLGMGYQAVALLGFQQGFNDVARECLRRADAYGVRTPGSGKRLGRMLERMIGLEHKERVIQWLARRGIATRDRREALAAQEALRADRPAA
ncbi:MAG TPA: glycosyltransferase family A protein [Longimicrobium sp.]|jgi:glycosyltransferase involved in cell wall biosynthesis